MSAGSIYDYTIVAFGNIYEIRFHSILRCYAWYFNDFSVGGNSESVNFLLVLLQFYNNSLNLDGTMKLKLGMLCIALMSIYGFATLSPDVVDML